MWVAKTGSLATPYMMQSGEGAVNPYTWSILNTGYFPTEKFCPVIAVGAGHPPARQGTEASTLSIPLLPCYEL